MRCPQCQHESPDRAKFCLECGTRLALSCAQCSAELPPNAKFCPECGHPAGAAPTAPAAQPTSRFTSPQTYTPQHLAERILTSRDALEGERKQLTVLFADLKGSMELLADRDPEEARRILDPVLERMMEAVHRYEGTVNQVMGDGIMALFGAPLAHEDHAVRACYAALHMQEGVREYAQQVQRTEGLPLHIRVGLNSGEVVVRSIGSDLRMDYTAVGQTTHLAARMEQMAMPGSILLAPDTLQLAEGYVQVKALGLMQVKGLAAPIEVHELVGAGTARSRLQAAAARGLTKFLGRDAELETLRRTLEQAGRGHGQVVALVGEPGVGKSRLVWEFRHSHRTQGWLVLQSGSVSYGSATSYLPVIELLKIYCGIEDRDDARRIREKVTGKLLTVDPALQPTLSPLVSLLDLPVDDAQWQALDPPQRRQRTLDAVKRLLLRESQEQPLLLIFEDLHWTDAETQALLDSLVESLPTARILLLVNYRPEYAHTWHRKTYYQQLRLDPLPPESAEELLTALLGAADELTPLKRVLVERTEGNPFFVEESVRTLVEGGVIVGECGTYRLAKPFESTQVPPTVQAVLAARIDRLAPEDKRLLQSAAVIGKDVPYALLRAIAELAEDALRQSLGRLQAAEFLYETSLFPDLEYTFKHALTHEVAYGSLLHERRRTLHTAIMEAIERLYPDRLAEHVERLAHHALRGEAWPKVVQYGWQAGAKADARSAHPEAVAYFEQALDALQYLAESRATLEQAVGVRLDLRNSLMPSAGYQRIYDCLREAEIAAEALGDPRWLARVYTQMLSHLWGVGELERAVAYGQRALRLAMDMGDSIQVAVTNLPLGRAYCALGEYSRAIECFKGTAATLHGDQARERFDQLNFPSAGSRSWLARCCADRGQFAEGLAWANEAVHITEALDHPFGRAVGYRNMGYVYLIQGDLDNAIPWLERSLEVGRLWHNLHDRPDATSTLGCAYARVGRVAEALPLLEEGVAESLNVYRWADYSLRLAWLGEAYLLAGRAEDALDTAGRALQRAQQQKERGHEGWVLRLLGEIATTADPPNVAQAEGYYGEALALAEELEVRPLVAHCHLSLGTLYQKVGRDEQAHAELATAAEMYRSMEMTLWLEKAEAALAEAGAA
jgi:class 3 adenylate cyclase/tetratricopeptide (TPR) repeat protein